jgi:hypothetical protein
MGDSRFGGQTANGELFHSKRFCYS